MATYSAPSWSVATTGRLTMAPVPRMADVPTGTIGVSKSAPPDPVLVTVKVPPLSSSGVTLFARVRVARSAIFRAIPARLRSPAPRMTGTTRPRSVSTAMPTFSSPW